MKIDDKHSYYLYKQDIETVLSILKNNLNEYLNNKEGNIHYVYIDDIVKFSTLLNKLTISLDGKYDDNGHEISFSILNGVWLRMSADEFNDVYKFLERQILFNENKCLELSKSPLEDYYKKNYICNLKNFNVCYIIRGAGAWYETNKKISIFIENNEFEHVLLPEIYFETIRNGDKNICYVYSIQTSKHNKWNKNIKIEDSLVDIKKELRNKYVNYKFVLALKFFIEILKENGISDIRVPLLQIFNYDYHISMSEEYKLRMTYLENEVREGRLTYDSYNYVYNKELFDKVVDKQDVISKNKTEKLIGTFIVLEEKFSDINILSEPFIQDENLIVKILQPSKTKSLKKS